MLIGHEFSNRQQMRPETSPPCKKTPSPNAKLNSLTLEVGIPPSSPFPQGSRPELLFLPHSPRLTSSYSYLKVSFTFNPPMSTAIFQTSSPASSSFSMILPRRQTAIIPNDFQNTNFPSPLEDKKKIRTPSPPFRHSSPLLGPTLFRSYRQCWRIASLLPPTLPPAKIAAITCIF